LLVRYQDRYQTGLAGRRRRCRDDRHAVIVWRDRNADNPCYRARNADPDGLVARVSNCELWDRIADPHDRLPSNHRKPYTNPVAIVSVRRYPNCHDGIRTHLAARGRFRWRDRLDQPELHEGIDAFGPTRFHTQTLPVADPWRAYLCRGARGRPRGEIAGRRLRLPARSRR